MFFIYFLLPLKESNKEKAPEKTTSPCFSPIAQCHFPPPNRLQFALPNKFGTGYFRLALAHIILTIVTIKIKSLTNLFGKKSGILEVAKM